MFHLFRVVRSIVREKLKEHQRSTQWPGVRDAFLKENSFCAACGGTVRLQVHHVQPFHLYPELELNPSNLITLCMGKEECHLLLGHGDNWSHWNPDIRTDVTKFHKNPSTRLDLINYIKNKSKTF